MKKRHVLPIMLLFSLGFIISCSNPATSSVSSIDSNDIENSSNSNSSVDSKNDDIVEDSASGIANALLSMKGNLNFTVISDYDGTILQFTKKYYESTTRKEQKTAYVNLPFHKDANKEAAYKVKYPKKGNPFVSALGYKTDIYGNRFELTFDDLNFLSSIGENLNDSVFVKTDNLYNTEDNGILLSFMNFYGENDIGKVSFWVDEGGSSLNYEVFSTTNKSLTTGHFYHINNTKNDALEDLVGHFSWEEEGRALTKEQASSLFDENFSSSTNVSVIPLGGSETRIAEINFKCNENTMLINAINDPDGTKTNYVAYFKKRESDGRAIECGLNAQNEQSEEETLYFFDQYDFPKDLDIHDFRLCGDGQYRYFSLEPNLVYQTFAHVSVNDANCSFEEVILNLENNKVVSVTMNSPTVQFNRYQAITTLNPYDNIVLPSSYGEPGPSEIVRAMSYFDGAYEHPFKVVKTNQAENPTKRTSYLFDGKTYLIQEESYDKASSIWSNVSTKGYTRKDDGSILAFRQIKGKNKLVQSEDIVAGDKITNYFPKQIDPRTTQKESDGSFIFKELITNATGSTWISNNAIPNTVKMKTNRQGLLSDIEYGVSYSNYSKEYLTFNYEDISLPDSIDINNIGPMELTSYSDDSPDEWQDLVNYIGEEYANLIPYYYDKHHVGKWYAEPRYSSGTGVPDKNDKGETDYNDPLIGVGLYCAGSSVSTSVLDEGFAKNGFKKITTGEKLDIGYRDDDYIANGRDNNIYEIDTSVQTVWVLEGKMRVIYDSDIAFYHFSPSQAPKYTLSSGLLIQLLDGREINRTGNFH